MHTLFDPAILFLGIYLKIYQGYQDVCTRLLTVTKSVMRKTGHMD